MENIKNKKALRHEYKQKKKALKLEYKDILKVFRDTVSGFTHMGGGVLAIIGAVFLCIKSDSVGTLVSYLIFGISMFLLFGASTTYHLVTKNSVIKAFHKLDHAMIYVLIAGTYTPLIYRAFSGSVQFWFMFGIWAFTLLGVIFKLFFTGRFRIVSTLLYIIMGWACVFSMKTVSAVLGTGGVMWLISGGLFYTIGGVIYALKWPGKNKEHFGFHEIFHIFVLLGAISLYFTIYLYL